MALEYNPNLWFSSFTFISGEGPCMKKEWNANANLGKQTFMQSFGSQEWDTGFAIQALLASNLTDEIGPTLARGHDFIKKSQVWFPTLKVSSQYSHQLCFLA